MLRLMILIYVLIDDTIMGCGLNSNPMRIICAHVFVYIVFVYYSRILHTFEFILGCFL